MGYIGYFLEPLHACGIIPVSPLPRPTHSEQSAVQLQSAVRTEVKARGLTLTVVSAGGTVRCTVVRHCVTEVTNHLRGSPYPLTSLLTPFSQQSAVSGSHTSSRHVSQQSVILCDHVSTTYWLCPNGTGAWIRSINIYMLLWCWRCPETHPN